MEALKYYEALIEELINHDETKAASGRHHTKKAAIKDLVDVVAKNASEAGKAKNLRFQKASAEMMSIHLSCDPSIKTFKTLGKRLKDIRRKDKSNRGKQLELPLLLAWFYTFRKREAKKWHARWMKKTGSEAPFQPLNSLPYEVKTRHEFYKTVKSIAKQKSDIKQPDLVGSNSPEISNSHNEIDWTYEASIAPKTVPPPNASESWSEEILPRSFTPLVFANTELGLSRYQPYNATWLGNELFLRVSDKLTNTRSRLYCWHPAASEMYPTFKHAGNVSSGGQNWIITGNKEEPILVLSQCSGIELYSISNPEMKIELASSLRSRTVPISDKKVGFLCFGKDEETRSHIYSPNQNYVSVSNEGLILHLVFVWAEDTPLGKRGEKAILWSRTHSTEVEYTARVIKAPEDVRFQHAHWANSERFISLNDGYILDIEKGEFINLVERSDFEDDGWWPFMGHSAARWHPNEDAFVTISQKMIEGDEILYGVEIWDATTFKCVRRKSLRKPHFIRSFDWSPDGRKIAFTHSDRTISIWDLKSDEVKSVFVGSGKISCLKFSPDSQRISAQLTRADNETSQFVIIATNDAEELCRFDGNVALLTRSPWHEDGEQIAFENKGKLGITRLQTR